MQIDLNADLGESDPVAGLVFDDPAMLDLVTSANIACGHHAGGGAQLVEACAGAAARQLSVGAHVSYLDRANFGRTPMQVEPEHLTGWIWEQLEAISTACAQTGAQLGYVKPHGALYNTIVTDQAQAETVVRALETWRGGGQGLALLGLPHSWVQQAADRAGVPFFVEAFADRDYLADGTLVPRSQPGALLHDPELVAARMLRLVTEGVIEAIDGSLVEVRPDSICVHGDSPAAVAMASAVRSSLVEAGVELVPFVGR